MGVRVYTWLSLKSVFSVAEEYGAHEKGDLGDIVQAGLQGLAERAVNPQIKHTPYLAAESSIITYIAQRDNVPEAWIRASEIGARYQELSEIAGDQKVGIDKNKLDTGIVALAEEAGVTEQTVYDNLSHKFATHSLQPRDLERPDTTTASTTVDRQADVDALKLAMAKLTEREAEALRLHFGFDGVENRTFEEVGAAMRVTKIRAQQLEYNAFAKLAKQRDLLKGEQASHSESVKVPQNPEPMKRASRTAQENAAVQRILERAAQAQQRTVEELTAQEQWDILTAARDSLREKAGIEALLSEARALDRTSEEGWARGKQVDAEVKILVSELSELPESRGIKRVRGELADQLWGDDPKKNKEEAVIEGTDPQAGEINLSGATTPNEPEKRYGGGPSGIGQGETRFLPPEPPIIRDKWHQDFNR